MKGSWIIGIFSTAVGRFPEKGPIELTRDAYLGVLADARLTDASDIGGAWYGNLFFDYWGQSHVKGQACMTPLVNEGLFPKGVPVINVEGACATGSLAFNGALTAVQSGRYDLALGIGVEKMYDPTSAKAMLSHMERAADWMDPDSWKALYQQAAERIGTTFETGNDRSIAMDIYALWARSHMVRYGTKPEHIAAAAAKNHNNSVNNPRAQYRFPMNVEDILNDRMVCEPLTRAMCAPIGDGSAAVLVCSDNYLQGCAPEVKDRAIPVRSHELVGGVFDVTWEDERSPVVAARRAYSTAGVCPGDIDVVELHDASSFAEIHLVEDLGFCERGQGGPFTGSGATAIDGKVAINTSGGLISRGHPIGATGIMMLNELCIQLRGEANENQVKNARYGLAENGGGIVGNDIALCSVTILERPNSQ